MWWNKTKKWILEYLGKDSKDTRWLDRAVDKWIIYHDIDRGYILCTEYIEGLKVDKNDNHMVDKNDNLVVSTLENKIRELEEELKKKSVETTTPSSTHVDSDLLDHLALMYIYVEKKNEFMNKVVKSYYDKFSGQYDREWAVEKVYGMYWYTPDEWENDELEYVKSLIS